MPTPITAAACSEREKKNYEKAIDDFSQAIRLEPERAVAYCDRGYAWKSREEV